MEDQNLDPPANFLHVSYGIIICKAYNRKDPANRLHLDFKG